MLFWSYSRIARSTACILTGLLLMNFPHVQTIWATARSSQTQVAAKPVSFTIEEDYPKGTNLQRVARDFQLMKQLGITTLRDSFAWDDFEPEVGQYDFTWLKQFLQLAKESGIKIRPWVGYTPSWAAAGSSNTAWNEPPKSLKDWYNFVYRLASVCKPYHVVLSYEMYNEEDSTTWWSGTAQQYAQTLKQGALAVRAADPRVPVLLGGMTNPDTSWLESIQQAHDDSYYNIIPFHAYPETGDPGQPWDPGTVETFPGTEYTDDFFPYVQKQAGNKPVWLNEMGYATADGNSEQAQANWFARAFSTYLSFPGVQELGVFRIRDLKPGNANIGGAPNYHLGLVEYNGKKKLAFSTVKLLVHLLNDKSLTVADTQVHVSVTSGEEGELYCHLFKRPDGKQILFAYNTLGNPTINITLLTSSKTAYRYALNGKATRWKSFDGHTIHGVPLTPGNVAIFEIDP